MNDFETSAEGELIRRVQSGEAEAFKQIAQQNGELLYRGAFLLCRDRQRAEDIAQETLLEAWRSLGRFDGRCRFSTWLYGILRHRFLKARQRDARRIMAPLPLDDPSPQAPTQLHAAADPVGHSERAEDAERIREAVAELPDEHRQVIELRFFADAKLDDIAAALGIPLGTVKSRLHHGLEKLRQRNLAVNLFSASRETRVRQS
jgi:RNA polymerase sigma-70 factor (ECF subfamily)